MLQTSVCSQTYVAYPAPPVGQHAVMAAPRDRSSGGKAHGAARILIVEDDFLAASDMETVLTEAGYQVAGIANRADEALRLAKSESPALIVMDIRLIGKADGIDAALEIFRETGIRCVFATAHHDQHMRSRAQGAAPLGWLPKPYAAHALIATVKHAIAQL